MQRPSYCAIGAVLVILNTCAFGAQSDQRPEPQSRGDLEILVPPGTVIPIVLSSYLNSKSTQVGDTFYADTVYPIWIQQRLVIPKGSTIRGTVTGVTRPGRIKGKGRLAIRIDDVLLPNGVKRDLVAGFKGIHGPGEEQLDRRSESVEAGGTQGEDAGTVVSNTGKGAIIGVLAGGGKGAGIGAGAGAAVGLATILLSRGRDLILDPGTQFDIELKQPIRFAYGELDFTAAQIEGAQRTPIPRQSNQREAGRIPSGRFGRLGLPIPW
jgi:hypothetical protein